jgi:hypothetical protein
MTRRCAVTAEPSTLKVSRHPARVLTAFLGGQQVTDRQAAQPVQVGAVGQVLAGDDPSSLRERQWQAP